MGIQTATAYTSHVDSREAGEELGRQLREALGQAPDAVVVFASSRFEHADLLRALTSACGAKVIVGASSAGEFTRHDRGEGVACALGIRSPDMSFSVGLGTSISDDVEGAAAAVLSGFRGITGKRFPYRAALVLTDALAGHADALVDCLTDGTRGGYMFFGGGAGDDGHFARTHVFRGEEAFSNAAVALEILSPHPIAVGVGHGWIPASEPMRVTEVQGTRVIGIDGAPAVEAFEQHAERTGQRLDRAGPLPFFLHNILGVETPSGHRLRVPLAIDREGAVQCAAEIPHGAIVRIMKTTNESAIEAGAGAVSSAIASLHGAQPKAALLFDCVATRLRMGDVFGLEVRQIADALGDASLVGCNTYGQIARAEGQFGGFHNCTAVVCVFAE